MFEQSGTRGSRLRKQIGARGRLFHWQRDRRAVDPRQQVPENFVLRPREVGETIHGEELDGSERASHPFGQCRAGQPETALVVVPVLLGEARLITLIDATEFRIPL